MIRAISHPVCKLLMTACAGFLIPASAATFSFTTTSLTKTDAGLGVTLTASAWTLDGVNFNAAQAAIFSGIGTGVCNTAEGPVDCGFSPHHIDNASLGGVDFFLIKFSSPVDPISMQIQTWVSGDLDATYWVGNVANPNTFTLTGLTTATLPAGFTKFDSDSSATGSRTVNIGGSTNANILIFGARTGHTDDYFKLITLNADAPTVANPEPATLAMFGSALIAAGLLKRRRA